MCSQIMPGNLKSTEYMKCGYVVFRIILKWILMTYSKVLVYGLRSSASECEIMMDYARP